MNRSPPSPRPPDDNIHGPFRSGAGVGAAAAGVGRRRPTPAAVDGSDARNGGSVSVPEHLPFSEPRQSSSHRNIFPQPSNRQTTTHRPPVSHNPVAPLASDAHDNNNSKKKFSAAIASQKSSSSSAAAAAATLSYHGTHIPTPSRSSGVAGLDRHKFKPLRPNPSRLDLDSQTSTISFTSATEPKDLSRLQKLKAAKPLFSRDTPDPFASLVEDLTGHSSEREDTSRHRDWLNAPQSKHRAPPSHPPDSGIDSMIRRRIATGEEVVVGAAQAPVSPDRPDNLAGFRDFASRPKSELPSRIPIDDSARLERERLAREREAKEKEEAERAKKEKGNKPGWWSTLGRKPSKGKNETEWPPSSGDTDGRASAEAKRTKSGLPTRRSPSLSLGEKRSDERSHIRTPTHRERPASAASIERRRSVVNAVYSPGDRISKHSRIPSSVSPVVSRPTSSHDRRTFSTISSTSERRPLRSTPSTTSLASRTSETSSARGSHSRSESHPTPSTADKRAMVKSLSSSSHDARRVPKKEPYKRSESAPSNNFSIAMPGPSGFSRTPSLKTEKSSDSDKANSDASKIDSASPTRKRRGDSIDSFLGGTPLAESTDPAPQTPANPKEKPAAVGSPSLTDYMKFVAEKGGNGSIYSSTPSSGSPLYDRSTGLPKEFPKPKSALQDDEEETMSVLDELNKKDQEYAQILNAPKGEDEDDTYMLLGGSERYEPLQGQRVRPKAEAIAGDRTWQKEKSEREQMMSRLKTLHLELRNARRGIGYIERRLNGVGSSDESEWVDDEDGLDGDIIAKRARAEARRKSKKAETVDAVASTTGTDAVANAAVEPVVEATPVVKEPSTAIKVCTVAAQLVLIWFALEIYFFYTSFPPSSSREPIYVTTVPSFGSQIARTSAMTIVTIFRTIFSVPAAFFGVLVTIWNGIFGLLSGSNINHDVPMYQASTPSGEEFVVR
ncbi:hypothetical protein FN846DRAFT_11450 [Sphaerosporella brunnea]|uniref:Uncharacterized protein n=1 Tax=Sphaerosporella brunnea TaxID=1250544 RepID=A0A5J5EW49_9PEZI|nr:hypothetical protein FN846DRAFT_11450 [Sphaerosporella brunnea]